MTIIQTDIQIQHLNSFGLPCRASGLCQVDSSEALQAALADTRFNGKPYLILGGGSNVVLPKCFDGLIIQPAWFGIHVIDENSDHILLRVGAAESWHKLVTWVTQHNWYGIENLAAIPGWCGAAPMQNIGAYGVEFSDVCVSVGIIDSANGQQQQIEASDCQFSYRHSIFKTPIAQSWVVTDITLQLKRQGILRLDYPGVADALESQGIKHPTTNDIASVITDIRNKKLPDPKQLGNAGSFFKNPIISTSHAEQLLSLHPKLPHWPNGEQVKLSAAWLIDQCGWKGYRDGAIGVHHQHALVLVHYGQGNAQQLLQLANHIKHDVNQTFGIDLQPEPNIIQ